MITESITCRHCQSANIFKNGSNGVGKVARQNNYVERWNNTLRQIL